MTAIAQPSFTTGELTPSLYGRVDLARYYTALKTCRNFVVRPYGGVTNRAGTQFCNEVKTSSKKTRLIEFVFSSSQTYVLEFGDLYIRVMANGGYVLDGGVPVEVVSPYTEADLPLLKYVQSADVLTICHPSHKQQQLSRLSNTSWTLTEFTNSGGPFLDINVDTAKTVRASGVSGAVTITANASIFTAEMVGRMFYIEQAPNKSVSRWEVQKEILVNDIRHAGAGYYQALNSGTTGTVRPSILEGSEQDGDPGVTWQYLHSGFGIVKITGYTSGTVVTGTVQSRLPDSVVTGSQSRAITGATASDPDVTPGSGDEYVTVACAGHGFSNGDSVTISGVVGMTDINGTWTITVVDANSFKIFVSTVQTYTSDGTAARTLSATETYKWAVEAWGGEQGYPATTIYYQQRQVFGGTSGRPATVWESKTAGYLDFSQSNPLLDDDAISFNLQSLRMNEIRHFVGLRELVALTSEGAWLIKKEQGNMIPVVDFQGRGGASNVPPVLVGQKALYVQEKGGAIRSLGYSFETDAYKGDDLTLTGSHLLFGKSVVEWAYQEVPFSTIWMVLNDGTMLGLTYLPDQDVVGWHRHDTKDGAFESICCIPEGNEDAVYAVVKRVIGGVTKRYIERFKSRFFTEIEDAFFVDSGLTYDGRETGAGVTFTLSGGTDWSYQETLNFTTTTDFFSGTSDVGDMIVLHETATAEALLNDPDAVGEALRLIITEYVNAKTVKVRANRTVPAEFRNIAGTGFQVGRDTFTGLDHLEGKEVAILADGNVEARQTITGGSFHLDNPAVVVHAGLPIEADIETLDINVQGQSLQDKVKNVRSVTLIVEKTRGLQAGPDENNLMELSPRMSGSYDNPIEQDTGPIKANIKSSWTDGGRVLIRQDKPLPATILAAIPEVAVGGA